MMPDVVWLQRLLQNRFDVLDDDETLVGQVLPDAAANRDLSVVDPAARTLFQLTRHLDWGHTFEMALPNDDLLATLHQEFADTTLTMGDGAVLDVIARSLGSEFEVLDPSGELLAFIARRRCPGRHHLDPEAHRIGFAATTPHEQRLAILGTVIVLDLIRAEGAQFLARNLP